MPHISKEARREYNRVWKAKLKKDPVRSLILKERMRDRAVKKWREMPREKRDRHNKMRVAWTRRNAEKVLLMSAGVRARKLGLPFNLVLEDISIPPRCPILGIELKKRHKKGAYDNSPTVDRIIPELGYVRGNIAVISHKANRCKNDATADDLIRIAIWIKHNAPLAEPPKIVEIEAAKETVLPAPHVPEKVPQAPPPQLSLLFQQSNPLARAAPATIF